MLQRGKKINRRFTTDALTQLNTMCERLLALPRLRAAKFKRCVELAVLSTALRRILSGTKGNAVGVSLGKLVSVLREDAKACCVAWEYGKLNYASYVIKQHVKELYLVQVQSGELLVLGSYRYTWLLSRQGAKMLMNMLAAKYNTYCSS